MIEFIKKMMWFDGFRIFYFRILNLFRISYFDIRVFHCVYDPGTQNSLRMCVKWMILLGKSSISHTGVVPAGGAGRVVISDR
jgi:hypothetical protein